MILTDHKQWMLSQIAASQGGAGESWQREARTLDERSEAIMFIKPEITSAGQNATMLLIDLVTSKLNDWSIDVQAVGILGWRHLVDRNLMGEHYGVINRVSREGLGALNENTKHNLAELGWRDEEVFGGHQFLQRFSEFTPATLSVLWDNLNRVSVRIAPGTYAIRVQVLSEYVWLLNGFHPYQLEHFNAHGKAIIVISLRTNADWAMLRASLIGDTDPVIAAPESIRANLLRYAAEWNVPVVNKGLNGIHLSAGPLEGMVELVRFMGMSAVSGDPYLKTNFGAQLAAKLGSSAPSFFAGNPTLTVDGLSVSAFDATEAKNPMDAINILSRGYS